MPGELIFISHATVDDDFVRDLRLALEGLGHAVWVDSRSLRGGDDLNAEIETAIREARCFIAVVSTQTANSPWVKKEIDLALAVQDEQGEDYRVLPLLLPGMKPAALGLWFSREPVAVPVELEPGAGRSPACHPFRAGSANARRPRTTATGRPVAGG